jgi:hypothetical protein
MIDVAAYVFGLIAAGFIFGKIQNLRPMFEPATGGSDLVGFFWIFAVCAMLLNGFQASMGTT